MFVVSSRSHGRTVFPFPGLVVCCLLPAAWLIMAGCEGARSSPPPVPATSPATQTAPAAPDAFGPEEEAGMEILVKHPALDRSRDENAYEVDEKTPSGRLVGACRWAKPIIRWTDFPPPEPVDAAKAIDKPDKGEVEYFQNLKLIRPRYYVANHLGTCPTQVVLRLRDIRKGRQGMYQRATYLVRQGVFRPHIQFGPTNERVMLGTYDSYPTDTLVKNMETGKVYLDGLVSAFDKDTIKPLGGGGVHFTARPTMQQTAVLDRPGGYAIVGKRHAWKTAWIFVVDNPYAVVSDGKFTIENVPVGTWKMDVWHPAFKPVAETIEVKITQDATTEVAVDFIPPDEILAKPKADAPGK